MTVVLAAPRLLLPGRCWGGPATVTMQDGAIASVTGGPAPPEAQLLDGGVLTPGIDRPAQ